MQIEFDVNNIKAFSAWLKRFATIDKSLLLEVDLTSKEFLAKTYNESHSVVKFSRIGFEAIGFELKTKKTPEARLKVGLYDVHNIIKTFQQFPEKFQFIIKYEVMEEDAGTSYVGKQVLIKTDSLKVGFECTSISIFRYITDQVFSGICAVDSQLSFDLKADDFNKIISLSDLDKEYKKLEFRAEAGSIRMRSRSFELSIGICNGEAVKFPILKEQFEKVDSESYQVAIGTDRMVLTSIDSATTISLGGVNDNAYETEKEMEL